MTEIDPGPSKDKRPPPCATVEPKCLGLFSGFHSAVGNNVGPKEVRGVSPQRDFLQNISSLQGSVSLIGDSSHGLHLPATEFTIFIRATASGLQVTFKGKLAVRLVAVNVLEMVTSF